MTDRGIGGTGDDHLCPARGVMRLDDWCLVDGDVRVPLTRTQLLVIGAMTYGRTSLVESLVYAVHLGKDPGSDPDSVVKVMISQMRRKFVAAGLGMVILAVRGHGYTLDRPIEPAKRGPLDVVIPAAHTAALVRLLYSHPDHVAADRVLSSFVGG